MIKVTIIELFFLKITLMKMDCNHANLFGIKRFLIV
jgi:hypothetical protein